MISCLFSPNWTVPGAVNKPEQCWHILPHPSLFSWTGTGGEEGEGGGEILAESVGESCCWLEHKPCQWDGMQRTVSTRSGLKGIQSPVLSKPQPLRLGSPRNIL